MTVYGNAIVAAKIAARLDECARWFEIGGRVATSKGAFISGTDVRMPDIAYTPRITDRGLLAASRRTYHGDPFVPSVVVDIDNLSGEGSRFSALDHKMRNEYFQHGVQLGWLIDPHPDSRKMYEYYLDENGEVQRSDNTAWRDLDGRDVLPGFRIHSVELDMVLSQKSGSSSEEEIDFTCPERGCGKQFRSRGAWTAHAEWHRQEYAIAKYLTNCENQCGNCKVGPSPKC